MFRLYVDQASIKTKAIEPLTSGRVGLKVQISFNQDWLNLTKIVSYEYRTPGEPTIEIQDEEFDGVVSTVPAGVLENSGGELYISIRGMNEETTVIPTIYALMGVVRESFIPEYVPTPTAHTHSNKDALDRITGNENYYSKPDEGIPASDLSSDVQNFLDKDFYELPEGGIPITQLSREIQAILNPEIVYNEPNIISVNPSRIKEVHGGWAKIGKIVFVQLSVKINDNVTFNANDWYSVLNGFPIPINIEASNAILSAISYLENSPWTTKACSAFISSTGTLGIITHASSFNAGDIIRVGGVYLTNS